MSFFPVMSNLHYHLDLGTRLYNLLANKQEIYICGLSQRTSDSGIGNHSVSLPIFLIIKSNASINDIVLIFTFIAPERSPIYTPENDDGIILLNENFLEIRSVYTKNRK